MTQYVQEKVASIENPVTAWALVAIAFVMVGLYGYFINGAIVNIVAARSAQNSIAALTSAVGDLETTYLAARSDLTLEYAHSIGFTEAPVGASSYIASKPTGSLTFNR